MNGYLRMFCALALYFSAPALAWSPAPCKVIDPPHPDWEIYPKVAISKMCERYPDECADMKASMVCSDETNTEVTIEVRGEFFCIVVLNRSTSEISSVSVPTLKASQPSK